MAKSIMDKIFATIATRQTEQSKSNDYLSSILNDRKEESSIDNLFSF